MLITTNVSHVYGTQIFKKAIHLYRVMLSSRVFMSFYLKLLLRYWCITLTRYGVVQQRSCSMQVFILNPSNAHKSGNQNKLQCSKHNKFWQYFLWNALHELDSELRREMGLYCVDHTCPDWLVWQFCNHPSSASPQMFKFLKEMSLITYFNSDLVILKLISD